MRVLPHLLSVHPSISYDRSPVVHFVIWVHELVINVGIYLPSVLTSHTMIKGWGNGLSHMTIRVESHDTSDNLL